MKITFEEIPYKQQALETCKQAAFSYLPQPDTTKQAEIMEQKTWKLILSIYVREDKLYLCVSMLVTLLLLICIHVLPNNPYIFIAYSLFHSAFSCSTIYLYHTYMDEILHPTYLSKAKKFLYRILILHLIEASYIIILYLFSATQLSIVPYLFCGLFPYLICNSILLLCQRLSNQISLFIVLYTMTSCVLFLSYEVLIKHFLQYPFLFSAILMLLYCLEIWCFYHKEREEILCLR